MVISTSNHGLPQQAEGQSYQDCDMVDSFINVRQKSFSSDFLMHCMYYGCLDNTNLNLSSTEMKLNNQMF